MDGERVDATHSETSTVRDVHGRGEAPPPVFGGTSVTHVCNSDLVVRQRVVTVGLDGPGERRRAHPAGEHSTNPRLHGTAEHRHYESTGGLEGGTRL
jgi:hypothetical protein